MITTYSMSEFLSGNKDESERVFELLKDNAKIKMNLVMIYGAKTTLHSYEGDFESAINAGIKILKNVKKE